MGGSWEHQKVLDWGRSGTCWCVLRAIVAIYFLVNFSTLYFPVNSNCALSICSCRTHWPTAVIVMNVCFHLVRCLDQRSGKIGMVSPLESRVNPGVKELPWSCVGTKGSCCPSVSLWRSFGMCGRGVASVVTGHLLSCPKAYDIVITTKVYSWKGNSSKEERKTRPFIFLYLKILRCTIKNY